MSKLFNRAYMWWRVRMVARRLKKFFTQPRWDVVWFAGAFAFAARAVLYFALTSVYLALVLLVVDVMVTMHLLRSVNKVIRQSNAEEKSVAVAVLGV
jgi:hypothetical protein